MKLFYGGCGRHQVFAVAENLKEAIVKIGAKINAPFLPIEAEEVDLDGYVLVQGVESADNFPPMTPTDGSTPSEPGTYHCNKCDFTTGNKGLLMAHYRKDHSKGA